MRIFELVLARLAPEECILCGKEGELVCAWCVPHAFDPIPDRCFLCKSQTPSAAVCTKCRKQTVLKHVWVATTYEKTAEKLIRLMKYSNKRSACRLIAQEIAATLPSLTANTVVSYVPTATSRVRSRGFDQCRLISMFLAKELGRPHKTYLKRLGHSRQVASTRARRIKQLQNAYVTNASRGIKKSEILLIDDVTTTGASLIEAAITLRKAGAKTIYGAVFAQKM